MQIKKIIWKTIINWWMCVITVIVILWLGGVIIHDVYQVYVDFCKEWGDGVFETNLVSNNHWERINCTAWNHGEINMEGRII